MPFGILTPLGAAIQDAFCAQKCEDIRREFGKLQYHL
jgi:hypothetical protein